MTTVVKSSDENKIAMPSYLMERLNLHDGDEVKAIIEGQSLRLARIDEFLALRGALAEDEEFDLAMELIDQAWQAWKSPTSA
jgi:antitoxin component of MazEF toxin-antitoxin module